MKTGQPYTHVRLRYRSKITGKISLGPWKRKTQEEYLQSFEQKKWSKRLTVEVERGLADFQGEQRKKSITKPKSW